MRVDVIQPIEDLNSTEKHQKDEFAHCLSQDIGTIGSQAFGLRLGLYLFPHILKPLGWDWTHTIGFPRPSAGREEVVGLLSLHDHLNQFQIINLPI